jgi:hypothetical protein
MTYEKASKATLCLDPHLHIPVGDAQAVAVVQCDNQLLEQPPDIVLWQPINLQAVQWKASAAAFLGADLPCGSLLGQVAAVRILHRNAQVVRSEKHLLQQDEPAQL